ncbi:hypothetical protein ACVWZN_000981 [Lysobacter sp. HA35]
MGRPAKTAEGVRGPMRATSHPVAVEPVPLPKAAVAIGMLWALPNTLIGLLLGALGMAFGAKPVLRRHDLACVFHRWPWGPGGAITIGNVILHTGNDLDVACATYAHAAGWGAEPAVSLALHERAHVYQYLVLGPLFLPMYLACGGVGVRNRFERAADRFAATGRGWWPWPAPWPGRE